MRESGKRSVTYAHSALFFNVSLSVQWFDLDAPEGSPFPGQYSQSLSELQQLLLLRCFRVDRVFRAITSYVTIKMGEQYVTPPVINLDSILEQSTPLSPIVFILSPGADPAGDLSKLAEVKGFGGNRFKFLAMGQGQESVSEQEVNVYDNASTYHRLHCNYWRLLLLVVIG